MFDQQNETAVKDRNVKNANDNYMCSSAESPLQRLSRLKDEYEFACAKSDKINLACMELEAQWSQARKKRNDALRNLTGALREFLPDHVVLMEKAQKVERDEF